MSKCTLGLQVQEDSHSNAYCGEIPAINWLYAIVLTTQTSVCNAYCMRIGVNEKSVVTDTSDTHYTARKQEKCHGLLACSDGYSKEASDMAYAFMSVMLQHCP